MSIVNSKGQEGGVTVSEEAEIYYDDGRKVRSYKVDVKVTKNDKKLCIPELFCTGELVWACKLVEEWSENYKSGVYFHLIPEMDSKYTPYVSITGFFTLTIKNDIPIMYTSSSPFGANYVKIGESGLLCHLMGLRRDKSVVRISFCLRVDTELAKYREFSDIILKTLTSGECSDMKIQVGEKTFPVHRHMLSALSPVFKNMFSHPMKESLDGLVEVNDCEPEAMELLLRYMYSGVLGETPDSGILRQLVHLTHRYQVTGLSELCEIRLASMLQCEEAVDTLKLADLYNLEFLKTQVMTFIEDNKKEVVNTPSWTELESSKPELVIQVLKFCLKL